MTCKNGHNKWQKCYPKEAEDIKKRWQEYTEEQKDLYDPDKHSGVITHL